MAANKFIIVGLGNPGKEYEETRHNTGRIILSLFAKKFEFPELSYDKKLNSLKSETKLGKSELMLLLPETFMNKSGEPLKKIITSKAKAANLVVIHDDLDIPLGKFKISFNRGSAGHKGIESIIKNIKTEGFIRIRVGITPTTPKGKLKKPENTKLLDFIVKKFKDEELKKIKGISKNIFEALELITKGELNKAMSSFN